MFGCLNHEVPLTSSDNASVTCETGRLGYACSPCRGYGGRTPQCVWRETGWEMAETVGASGPGAWHRVLCPCPSFAEGKGLPLPCSPRALPVRRVPGRLPALRQCHGQPQPPADPLPPDRQLVPEPALALCHGAWVRALSMSLPCAPRGDVPTMACIHVCRASVGVPSRCSVCHRSRVCTWLGGLCVTM